MRNILLVILLSFIFNGCQTKQDEAIIFKNKLSTEEYNTINIAVSHFNIYLKKCYPDLSYDDSYKQFLIDFIKDDTKKGFFTTNTEEKINNYVLNNTDVFKKIKEVNNAYVNPFKGRDKVFDEFYPNLYILNTESLFFKILEKNSTSNVRGYLNLLKKNKEYYSDDYTNYFLLNIDQIDYKYNATKLIIMFNFYYNISINNYKMHH